MTHDGYHETEIRPRLAGRTMHRYACSCEWVSPWSYAKASALELWREHKRAAA